MKLRCGYRRRQTPILHVAFDEGPRNGPVAVFVHGIASSSATFHDLLPLLDKRIRIIAVDLLGFGHSPSPKGATYTLDEHVDALERTIEQMQLPSHWVLVGHSLGALIAARFASRHPANLDSLVMVSPPVYVASTSLPDGAERRAMAAYARAFDYLRANKKFTIRNAAFIARLLPIRRALELTEHNWTSFELSLKNAIETQSTSADVAKARIPIDIVYGSLDVLIIPPALDALAALPRVSLHRVMGGDHLVRGTLAREVETIIAHRVGLAEPTSR